MPPVSQDDEFRMLYQALIVVDAKPRMEDLAVRMGLKTATTGYRWNKLMKRLKEEYDGGTPAPAAPTKATKAKANSNKRKRNNKTETSDGGDEEPATKKTEVKSQEPEIKDEGDVADAGAENSGGSED